MKLHSSKIRQVALEWVESAMVSKDEPLKSFVLLVAINYKLNNIEQMANALGCLDKEGYLDLEQAKELATKSIEKVGGKVFISEINWNFDQQDIDNIYQIAKNYGV